MSPSRSVSATIAGSAARIWSRARLESRQTRPIRFRLVWAAQAKVKAVAQRETTPRAIRHTHDLLSSPSTESLDVTTQCEQGGARSPGHQSRRVEIGSRAYSSAPRGEVSPLLRWVFQAVSSRLSTRSAWTGRIPAGRPAKEGLHGDCDGPAYQPGDIIGDPGHGAASEHDEVTHHVRHSPVAGGAVSSQGEQENDGAGQPPSSVSSPSDQR